jgi:hypothetical protein
MVPAGSRRSIYSGLPCEPRLREPREHYKYAVDITRVTNVYNTVVINRNVNNIEYANRNVNGGVTVVSHDTFVNARPVGAECGVVPARELAYCASGTQGVAV